MVAELAFVIQLRQPHHQALAGRDVGEHLGEQILHHLERGDRLAELQSLLGVLERVLEGAHLDAGRRPAHHVARHPQHPRGVAERVAACRRFASGTRTSFSVIWPFCTTLSAILCSIFSTLKPGVVLFSTMKPLT